MNWKKIIGATLAGAALFLGVSAVINYNKKSESKTTLENRIISDALTETEMPIQFKQLTQADEITLNNLEMHLNKYHSELDKILERRKIQEKESSQMMWQQVLNPLLSYIDGQNPEMLNYLLSRSGGKTDFSGDEFLKYLEEYFDEKGYSVVPQCRKSEYGTPHSIRMTKLLKIGMVSGELWGNQFNLKVKYLEWEPRVQEYITRRRKSENQVFAAENRGDTIYVHFNCDQFIIDKIRQGIENFNIQEPTTFEELFKALTKKGLQESKAVEKRLKSDLIHEVMHIIYKKTHNYSLEDIYARNMDELCSFLTELKNESTEFIYFQLGNIFNSKTIEYSGANRLMFSYFLTEIEGNRQEYQNIDYKKFDSTKKIDYLLMQMPKLTVDQIRNLAEKCFNKHFPELNKNYKPLGF